MTSSLSCARRKATCFALCCSRAPAFGSQSCGSIWSQGFGATLTSDAAQPDPLRGVVMPFQPRWGLPAARRMCQRACCFHGQHSGQHEDVAAVRILPQQRFDCHQLSGRSITHVSQSLSHIGWHLCAANTATMHGRYRFDLVRCLFAARSAPEPKLLLCKIRSGPRLFFICCTPVGTRTAGRRCRTLRQSWASASPTQTLRWRRRPRPWSWYAGLCSAPRRSTR